MVARRTGWFSTPVDKGGVFLSLVLMLATTSAQDPECQTPDTPVPDLLGPVLTCVHTSNSSSSNNEFYVPTQTDDVLTVRVVLHVIQKSDGSGNFQDDVADHIDYLISMFDVPGSLGGPNVNDIYANTQSQAHNGMIDPLLIGDTRVRFELMDLLFHQDDIGWYNESGCHDCSFTPYLCEDGCPNDCDACNSYLFDTYAVNPCEWLNIFIYGRMCDNYEATAGCGPGNYVVMQNVYSNYLQHPPGTLTAVYGSSYPVNVYGGDPFMVNGLMAHEIGHCLGFAHSWCNCGTDPFCMSYADQFPDMLCPQQENFWCSPYFFLGSPPCVNNVMGYSDSKTHWTPLQMGHMRQLLAGTHRTKWLTACERDTDLDKTITVDETWEWAKVIGGNITIEPGATLTIKCKVNMPIDGKIIVKPNARLIVDGGWITSNCCDNFWPGVEIWGDNAHNQFPSNHPTYQGMVVLKNGATIEHAREAFIVQQDGVWNTFGGVIQATDANFVNCRRSVAFASYQNTTPGGSPIGNRSRFTRCQFIVDDDYRGGTDFYAHVSMWDVSGIVFTACKFINAQTAQSTVFNSDELGYGIISLDANFTVTGSCDVIFPCEPGGLIPACPPGMLEPSEFIGLDHGIHATGSAGSTRTFTVTRSRFENNICGIFTSNVNNFSILRNEFVMGDRDVELTLAADEDHWMEHHRAIYNYKGIGFRIEENQFTRVPGPAPTLEVEGPVMGFSGAVNCQVYKNTSDGINHGFVAEGNCMDISDPMQTGLGFYCNTNTDNLGRDFVVRKPADDPITLGQSIKGFQGSPSLSAGNTFTPTQNDPAYEFYNYDNVAEYQSITYFWHAPPGQLNPGSYNTPWVQPYSTISPAHGCPSLIICGGGPAVKSLLSPEIEAAKTAWLSLRYVYESLLDGGDFEDLRETIMASWPSDAWDLRNELMAHSPFLSVEILFEAAERNILPDAMMLEICLANPEATRQQDFIHWIEFEAPNPLPHYMVEQIMASWDEETWRTSLEAAIAQQKGAMDHMNDQVIVALLNDSIPEPPDSILVRWQQNISLGARFGEAITLIEMGEYTDATALMEGLEDDYRMDERAEEERDDMLGLIGVYAAADLDQQDLMHLDNAKLDALQAIAEGSPTHAGVGAQNLLCFGYEICYPTITGSSHALRSLLSTEGAAGNNEPSLLNVLPNPASTWVAFEHQCDVASDPAELIVRDIAGREVQRLKVSTSPGQVVWDTRRQSPGTYAVELHHHGRILSTQRFVLRP